MSCGRGADCGDGNGAPADAGVGGFSLGGTHLSSPCIPLLRPGLSWRESAPRIDLLLSSAPIEIDRGGRIMFGGSLIGGSSFGLVGVGGGSSMSTDSASSVEVLDCPGT